MIRTMPRPIVATIHTEARPLTSSRGAPGCTAGARLGGGRRNAYGHGIERAYAGLAGAGTASALFGRTICEAASWLGAAPSCCWKAVLSCAPGTLFAPRSLAWCIMRRRSTCSPPIGPTRAANASSQMNSGMNRPGFRPQYCARPAAFLSGLTQVDEITLMTHFADADGAAAGRALEALKRSSRAIAGERSLSNSGDAAFRRGRGRRARIAADWVRPASWSTARRPIPAHDARWER